MKFLSILIVAPLFLACTSDKASRPQVVSTLDLDRGSNTTIDYDFTNKNSRVFKDVTRALGLENLAANSFTLIDLNEDGRQDLVLIPEQFSQPVFYLYKQEHSKFIKIPSLFPHKVKASFVSFADMNGDGIKDAIVGSMNQGTELRGEPLRILQGYKKKGMLSFSLGVAVFETTTPVADISLFDFDLDGDLDIFVANWLQGEGTRLSPHRNQLFENRGGKFFELTSLLTEELKTDASGLIHVNARPTIASQACDVNDDGYPDILTANSHGYRNKLWLNKYNFRGGGRVFVDYASKARYSASVESPLNETGGGRSFSVACADYNSDGLQDIFLGELTHSYDPQTRDKSSILTGHQRGFYPAFSRTEYFLDNNQLNWTQSDKGALWWDYDNDGREDLLVDNSGYPPYTRLLLFQQQINHSFTNVAAAAGIDIMNPRGSKFFDFNGDGQLDLITTRQNTRNAKIEPAIFVFKNIAKNKNNFVSINLKGVSSNPQGIGAAVTLSLRSQDETIYKRRKTITSSEDNGLHFGVAYKERPYAITVRWPYAKGENANAASMEKTYSFSLEKGNHVVICEGQGICKQH